MANSAWPKADPALVVDNVVTIVVQINGKLRANMEAAKDTDAKTLESQAMALPSIMDALKGKEVKKIVVVPNRIVNVVAA